MKSRYLINFVLLFLVLVLFWFLNKPSPTSRQNTVSEITQNEITNIVISRSGLDTITLQKHDTGWQLISPLQAPANNTRIKLLLSLLTTPIYAQLNQVDSAKLIQLGFNDASTIVQFNDYIFQFGTTEPISQHRYILHNNSVYLIDDNVAPLLKANAASFIDNKLIPLKRPISKISLPTINQQQEWSSKNIIIEQKDGHWYSDIKTLSADQLTMLIDAWQHTYALQVLPIGKTTLPESTRHTITIWFDNQTDPTELELQYDSRALYLSHYSLNLSYQLPISLRQQLFPNP